MEKESASRMAGFGFNVLGELRKAQSDKNVFISPISLYTALTMTWNGSARETRAAMSRVLGLDGLRAAEVNRQARDLMASLADADPDIKLSVANSLWARKGVTFLPRFINTNKGYFGAEVKEVVFGPEALVSINKWVKDQTQGKIPAIVDRIPDNAILYLINAVYFKAPWQDPFEQSRTSDGHFTLADGKEIIVPMMMRRGSYSYHDGDGFQAISMPYGKGRVSMYIFLPDKPSELEEFCSKLNAKTWDTWLAALRPVEVNLSLPRFKIEYGVEEGLKIALSKMGMAAAFDSGKADFSRMCKLDSQRVFISQVAHKTFVEVNEAGTEAAAATSVGMSFTSAPMKPVRMAVDHPFLCAICDNETGAVLFVGIVADPRS